MAPISKLCENRLCLYNPSTCPDRESTVTSWPVGPHSTAEPAGRAARSLKIKLVVWTHMSVFVISGCTVFPSTDEMHDFTCQVVKMAGIGEVDFLTFDPIARKGRAVKYDVQAVAVVVIVLKLLFLLDDNVEW